MLTIPSPGLFGLMLKYLRLVDAGDLSETRSKAHDAMMQKMRAERFDFVTRDDAREIAIEVVNSIRGLLGIIAKGETE